MRNRKKAKSDEKRLDDALEMTFPASDPTAPGHSTSTEPPARPVERKAPLITEDDIEQARRGKGHKQQR